MVSQVARECSGCHRVELRSGLHGTVPDSLSYLCLTALLVPFLGAKTRRDSRMEGFCNAYLASHSHVRLIGLFIVSIVTPDLLARRRGQPRFQTV